MYNQSINNMKGKTTFLAKAATLLFVMLFSLTGARATYVEIGDGGTLNNQYLPGYNYYKYSLTQQIYTAEEIGGSGTILSIAFKNTGAEKTRTYSVYMLATDKETFESKTDWVPMAATDLVFEGELTFTSNEWTVITLNTPFVYDGNSNLLVGVADNTGADSSSPHMTCLTFQATSQALRACRDSSPYDVSNPSVSGTLMNVKNQIILNVDGIVSVAKPDLFSYSNVTSNSAQINWSGGTGVFNLEYQKAGDTEWTRLFTNTTEETYTFTDLQALTTYKVRAQCVDNAGNVSGWFNIQFTTQIGFPYIENFASTTMPTGWELYTGLLDNILAGSASLTTTATQVWKVGTDNNVLDGIHVFSNIYGTSAQKWLTTPSVPIPSNAQLAFDVAYTAYSGTASAPATNGVDDKFVVLISTDKKATWTVLRQWDNAGSEFVLNDLNATTTPVVLDLEEYAGQTVNVAFYVESTISNADNNLHIDNVAFEEKPACETPYGIKISYTGGTEATISWASIEEAWDIDVNGVVTEDVDNPFTLTGLEYATVYNIKVRAKNASGVSAWSLPASFSTDISDDMCQIRLILQDAYGDGWDGNTIQVVDASTGIVIGTYTVDATAGKDPQTFIVNVPNGREIHFVWGETGTYPEECSYVVYDVNDALIFYGSNVISSPIVYQVDCKTYPWREPSFLEATEITYSSAKLSWSDNSLTPTKSWVVAYKAEEDKDFTEVITSENPFVLEGLIPETTYYVKVRPETDEAERWSEEYSFTTSEKYPKPTDLAASDITPNSATVTWTGIADSFELRYGLMPAGATSSSLLQYDNGEYATAIGNTSASEWTWGVMYPGSMVTDYQLDKVSIYESSYNTGDITIKVYQGGDIAPGELLYTETVSTEANEDFHEITLATPVALTPGENLWITLTEVGTYVIIACESSEPNNQWVDGGDGNWYNIGDLASSLAGYGWMIRANTSTLGFDPDAIKWTTISDITDNTYTLTELDPKTDYIVQVRGIYSDGNSSWASTSFTTESECDAPTNLAVSDIRSNSATISWKGFQNAYNVKVTIPGDIDLNVFTQVGSDITATGTATEYTFDLSAYSGTGAIAIRHYNVSDMFMLNLDDISLTNPIGATILTEDFQNAELPANWLNIDNDGDGEVWSIRTLYDSDNNPTGGYCATSASWTQAAGALNPDNWLIIPDVELGGTLTFNAWGQDANFPAEVFGVFVCEGDFMAPEVSQVIENVTTNPYVLEGLEPNTKYEVRVQGISEVCGGFTDWTNPVTFTTLTNNPVPFNIEADLAANAATLTWDGDGDSYQIAYMALDMDEKFYYNDFSYGLDNWTNIMEGTGPGSEGWNRMNIGSDDYPFYAAVSFSWYSENAYDADNWLISPQLDLEGTLKFFAYAAYGDEYEVLLSTTGNDPADFTTVLQAMGTVSDATNGDDVSIDLSAYAGQKGYIAFHHVFTDGFYLAISNVGLYGDGYVDAGEIQYVTSTEKTVTLTDLETNRIYGFIISSVKGEETSSWSDEIDFALLSLDSDADNRSIIVNADGLQAHVTLTNRTLYADGTWNTLAVPFDLTPEELATSPLAGADIRTLMGINVENTSVTLNFTPEGFFDTYGLWGGCPLIMKWATGSDIVNPEFANVTIFSDTWNYGYTDAASGYGVNFKSTYAYKGFTADDPSILFVGANNQLNYPLAGATIGAMRGFFELEGFTMDEGSGVKIFTDLDDLDDATGIATIKNNVEDGDWYDLSGRKLADKPSMKGIYVNGGRKVTVK